MSREKLNCQEVKRGREKKKSKWVNCGRLSSIGTISLKNSLTKIMKKNLFPKAHELFLIEHNAS
jgi:hypothetical protein